MCTGSVRHGHGIAQCVLGTVRHGHGIAQCVLGTVRHGHGIAQCVPYWVLLKHPNLTLLTA